MVGVTERDGGQLWFSDDACFLVYPLGLFVEWVSGPHMGLYDRNSFYGSPAENLQLEGILA